VQSKEEGGLGIKDIDKFNKALLAKWKWKIVAQTKGKWRDIIISKYEIDDTKYNNSTVKFQSRWWRDLGKVCGVGEIESWFNKANRCEIRRGHLVFFISKKNK